MKDTGDIELQIMNLSPTSSKVEILEKQVNDVQTILQNNIEIAIDNVDQTEDLESKTDSLSRFSKEFSVQAKKTKRKYYWKSKKLSLVIVGISSVLLYLGYKMF